MGHCPSRCTRLSPSGGAGAGALASAPYLMPLAVRRPGVGLDVRDLLERDQTPREFTRIAAQYTG